MIMDELRSSFSDDEMDMLAEFDIGQVFGNTVVNLTQGETAIAGIAAAAAIIAGSWKLIKTLATDPKCRRFAKVADIKLCNTIVKKRKQIEAIKSKAPLCKNSKDPSACNKKLTEKIRDLQNEIKGHENDLKIKI